MLTIPQVVRRPAQPYAAVAVTVAMDGLSNAVDKALPAVFGWLAAQGVAPAGPPFFRYLTIHMPSRMEIEFGVPTDRVLEADDGVATGELPSGRYASAMHTGPYDALVAATAQLLRWIADNGLAVDASETAAGERFGCRLEIYHTDPAAEPDPARLRTELAIGLAA